MFACCQRKDAKALTDYNLIESPRDQSRPLDLYTETASDDRKSFLRKRMPSVHTAHTRAHTVSMSSSSVSSSVSSFSLSFSLFLSLWSIVHLIVDCITTHAHSHVHRACITVSFRSSFFYPRKAHTFLARYSLFIVLGPFSSPLVTQFFLLSVLVCSFVSLLLNFQVCEVHACITNLSRPCACWPEDLFLDIKTACFCPKYPSTPLLTAVNVSLVDLGLSFSLFLCFSSRCKNSPVKIQSKSQRSTQKNTTLRRTKNLHE